MLHVTRVEKLIGEAQMSEEHKGFLGGIVGAYKLDAQLALREQVLMLVGVTFVASVFIWPCLLILLGQLLPVCGLLVVAGVNAVVGVLGVLYLPANFLTPRPSLRNMMRALCLVMFLLMASPLSSGPFLLGLLWAQGRDFRQAQRIQVGREFISLNAIATDQRYQTALCVFELCLQIGLPELVMLNKLTTDRYTILQKGLPFALCRVLEDIIESGQRVPLGKLPSKERAKWCQVEDQLRAHYARISHPDYY